MAKMQVIRGDRSDKWTLQIKFPQLRDSGIYECQVNTEPKMSMAFRLNVVGKCSKMFSIDFIIICWGKCNGIDCFHFKKNFDKCIDYRIKSGHFHKKKEEN